MGLVQEEVFTKVITPVVRTAASNPVVNAAVVSQNVTVPITSIKAVANHIVTPQPVGAVSTGIVFTENSSSDVFNKPSVVDASIYRILSMQNDMKTYTIGGKLNNEFSLFMSMGNKLTAGTLNNTSFVAFNNYLGSLGV